MEEFIQSVFITNKEILTLDSNKSARMADTSEVRAVPGRASGKARVPPSVRDRLMPLSWEAVRVVSQWPLGEINVLQKYFRRLGFQS